SLTDLEIDFGVLSEPEQASRSLFYFREPLPYADMPAIVAEMYSDACSSDAGAAERVQCLTSLKQRIEEKLPGLVRQYAIAWDGQRQCLTGLDAFGRKVLQDVWEQLEIDIARLTAELEVSWQQAERDAIDDFAEDRGRDFVGRQEILSRLLNLALSPTE